MADVFNKEHRSIIMSKVKASDTKPEIVVRRFLFSHGFRYRKNDKRYPGKPDIVLPKYKTIIFIHGCFWHGHSICGKTIPESNRQYWTEKIAKNIRRDKEHKGVLMSLGWRVITIWECELKNKKTIEQSLALLLSVIMKQ